MIYNRNATSIKSWESIFFIVVITAMSFFGFFARFISKANNLVDMLMIGISLCTLLIILNNDLFINSDQGLLSIIIALFTFSLVISSFLNLRINALIQYTLYVSYLIPLLLLRYMSSEEAYKVFLPLLLFIGVLQLPFDFLFPRTDQHILDSFSGTFSEANNKSRYLFMIIVCAIFNYRSKKRLVNMIALPMAVVAMLVSFKLGDSLFAYLFGLLAFVVGLLHKKKWLTLALFFICYVSVAYIFNKYEEEPLFLFTYNRFFDSEHGVYAIVNFAIKLLKENYFLGTGLGEFASRTSQSIGGLYLNAIPRTMIEYGVIFEKTVAPAGLPSYFLIVAEAGIIGIFIAGLLVYYLYKNSHSSYLGFTFFIYIFLVTMFSPSFYEGPDGAVFLYTFLVINKAMYYDPSKKSEDRGNMQVST